MVSDAPTLPPQPEAADVGSLRGAVGGPVHLPGEDAYVALATPWDLSVPTRPLAVVEVLSADDVAATVRWAAQRGVGVSVQCTGHGVPGDMAGTVLVHTGRLDECTIDPAGRARVGAGVRWRTVLEAAALHGLAPLCGSSPSVGVVGYTTGGGLGPAARTLGVAADRVRALDVVTGDGVVRHVTADSEPDLFWGLRGGKGALGIVTALEFELVPITTVYAGALYLDGGSAPAVLHAWRQWCADLPAEATTSVAIMNLPAMPGVPPELADRFTVAVRFVWTGDPAEGARVLAPMREVGAVLIDAVDVIPWAALEVVHADPEDPMPVHEASTLLRDLPAAAVDALLAVAGPGSGTPHLMTEIRQLGGAVAREPEVPSAFCGRDAAFSLLAIGLPVPPVAELVLEHSERLLDEMEPWSTGGTLPNFAERGPRSQYAWDEGTRARLADVARRYDPDRVLRTGRIA